MWRSRRRFARAAATPRWRVSSLARPERLEISRYRSGSLGKMMDALQEPRGRSASERSAVWSAANSADVIQFASLSRCTQSSEFNLKRPRNPLPTIARNGRQTQVRPPLHSRAPDPGSQPSYFSLTSLWLSKSMADLRIPICRSMPAPLIAPAPLVASTSLELPARDSTPALTRDGDSDSDDDAASSDDEAMTVDEGDADLDSRFERALSFAGFRPSPPTSEAALAGVPRSLRAPSWSADGEVAEGLALALRTIEA